jgi:hypothetical protein
LKCAEEGRRSVWRLNAAGVVVAVVVCFRLHCYCCLGVCVAVVLFGCTCLCC